MRDDEDEPSLLVDYLRAAEIVGKDVLDAAIADGRIRATPLNDRPGAPHLFSRAALERLARAGRQR